MKIDIEGDEWDLFDRIYDTALRAFKKPHEAFVVFHVHANNFGNLVNIGNVATPQTLEISFANQSCYCFKNTYESFQRQLIDLTIHPLQMFISEIFVFDGAGVPSPHLRRNRYPFIISG